jgi:hypothetical protein
MRVALSFFPDNHVITRLPFEQSKNVWITGQDASQLIFRELEKPSHARLLEWDLVDTCSGVTSA